MRATSEYVTEDGWGSFPNFKLVFFPRESCKLFYWNGEGKKNPVISEKCHNYINYFIEGTFSVLFDTDFLKSQSVL